MGRPPLYKNPEELEDKINEYFEKGIKTRKTIIGSGSNRREIEIEIPTISGLCHYLGFESRQSFYDYAERNQHETPEIKDQFAYIIKRARLFIEQEYEELLSEGNPAGAIFALKNMGWKDKQEIHETGEKVIRVVYDAPPGDEKPDK